MTGKPLETSALIKLTFAKNAEGQYHDPITYKVFSPHIHIVFLKNTGNVFDMASLQLLAIKAKTWRDLVSDEPFTREDIITIQVSREQLPLPGRAYSRTQVIWLRGICGSTIMSRRTRRSLVSSMVELRSGEADER